MPLDKLTRKQARYVAEDDKAIVEFAGKRKSLIILKDPIENPPKGYVQLVMSYKSERLVALIPEKIKYYMAGGMGGDSDTLDEIAEFYSDCGEFEGELYFDNVLSAVQTEVSMTARNSYHVHLLNRLANDKMQYSESEVERLCLKDKYVEDRVKAIAALQLGKGKDELRQAKLEDLLVDVTAKVPREITESYQVECDCGSHIEYRTKYRKKTVEEDQTFTSSPEIATLEGEIQTYRASKCAEMTEHDANLIKMYANLNYIASENPERQFDMVPPDNKGGGE